MTPTTAPATIATTPTLLPMSSYPPTAQLTTKFPCLCSPTGVARPVELGEGEDIVFLLFPPNAPSGANGSKPPPPPVSLELELGLDVRVGMALGLTLGLGLELGLPIGEELSKTNRESE